MKRIAQLIGFAGLSSFIAGAFWLKYLAFTWWSTRTSLCLIAVGLAVAGIGGALYKRSNESAQDPNPQPPSS
jgi:hypothetical protein